MIEVHRAVVPLPLSDLDLGRFVRPGTDIGRPRPQVLREKVLGGHEPTCNGVEGRSRNGGASLGGAHFPSSCDWFLSYGSNSTLVARMGPLVVRVRRPPGVAPGFAIGSQTFFLQQE